MDNQDKNNKKNSTDANLLGEEELEKVNGGAEEEDISLTGPATNNMRCPYCKTRTPHTPTANGLYLCNICNKVHKKQ